MGLSEILVMCWTLFAPIAIFMIVMLLIYFVVRKAVRDELKSGDTLPNR